MNHRPIASVTVLGAGLQGCCIALELARHGVDVMLLDQDTVPMNRASLRNEGKIHLGLVYANDPTLETARCVLEGALSFHPLLKRWLGESADTIQLSTPFHYVVARDSILSADELENHYSAVDSLYRNLLIANSDTNYLGSRPERLFRRLSTNELISWYDTRSVDAGFETAERSIDTDHLARLMRAAIEQNPMIVFDGAHRVESVERHENGFTVQCSTPDGPRALTTQQVVNATWENRSKIDAGLGLRRPDGLLHRLKYRVLAQLPNPLSEAPSVTMVIGRYGDVVVRPDSTLYLSWYPAALRGWSEDIAPPEWWEAPCRGEVSPEQAQEIAEQVIEAIDVWYPGIGNAKPFHVDAGAIVAYGRTDVDDTQSQLHDRSQIGVQSIEGYHTVDTGKLTTAPKFALLVARQVMEFLPKKFAR